jgi:hypothetical protein
MYKYMARKGRNIYNVKERTEYKYTHRKYESEIWSKLYL